jgi:hypothetical protein
MQVWSRSRWWYSIGEAVPEHRIQASGARVARRTPDRLPHAGGSMYIGIGTLVFILLILMIIYFLRRA